MKLHAAYFMSLAVVMFGQSLARLDKLTTVESYMDICLKGKNHKAKPGPENGLLKAFCSPWAERSCCTADEATNIHTDPTWLNFNWNHCGVLSARCREYFIMDSCFYSCSPNVGPWLVEDVRKIRTERFKGVPLCKPVCDRWWDACKDDLTCTDNWAENFNWSSGINTCPEGSKCRTFSAVFGNSVNFCENVFGSFKVAPESEKTNCFHLWFDPELGNPNEQVARRRAVEILDVEYKVRDGKQRKTGGHGGGISSLRNGNGRWLFGGLLVVLAFLL